MNTEDITPDYSFLIVTVEAVIEQIQQNEFTMAGAVLALDTETGDFDIVQQEFLQPGQVVILAGIDHESFGDVDQGDPGTIAESLYGEEGRWRSDIEERVEEVLLQIRDSRNVDWL